MDWNQLSDWLHWRRLLDVGLVAALVYQVLVLLRGSRSGSLLTSLGILFGVYYGSSADMLDLPTVHWILDKILASVVVVLVVLFQEDLRRALTSTLRSPLAGAPKARLSDEIIDEIVRAAAELSSRGLGALIVVEQQAPLDRYIHDGIAVDAELSWQILLAMFIPEHASPTHDGAVVVKKGRIAAAACFLPLAGGAGIPGTLGSRHRAALGLADETDAVVVVVSEETATCSLAHMGQLDLGLSPADLRERLRVLVGSTGHGEAWRDQSWRRRIHFHANADPMPLRPPAAHVPLPQDDGEEEAHLRPPAPILDLADDDDLSLQVDGLGEEDEPYAQESGDDS